MYVEIYSDGSCDASKNGGYGVYISIKDKNYHEEIEIYDGMGNTTSTQMELTAAITAIKYIQENFANKAKKIDLYADFEPIYKKMKNIHESRVLTSADKELWAELYNLSYVEKVSFHWVKGHAGNINNTRADKLAKAGRIKYLFSKKNKIFVYYHAKLNKKICYPGNEQNYLLNIIMKSENRNEDKILKKNSSCPYGRMEKDFIELLAFKEVLQYAIKNTPDIHNRKLIIFSDHPMIVRNVLSIKKGKFKIEEHRYNYLWKEIAIMLNDYDIELYKAIQSKLYYFNMSVEEHNYTQKKVRLIAA